MWSKTKGNIVYQLKIFDFFAFSFTKFHILYFNRSKWKYFEPVLPRLLPLWLGDIKWLFKTLRTRCWSWDTINLYDQYFGTLSLLFKYMITNLFRLHVLVAEAWRPDRPATSGGQRGVQWHLFRGQKVSLNLVT